MQLGEQIFELTGAPLPDVDTVITTTHSSCTLRYLAALESKRSPDSDVQHEFD
jgi:hypothetical protein